MLVRRLRSAVALVLSLTFPVPCFADFSGRVVTVAEGDAVTVLHEKRPVKIRLNGIDAPDKKQAFGIKAKQFASKMVFGKTVTIVEHGLDKYGRTIGDVILQDGTNVNQELVKAGMAWWYPKYALNDDTLRELEWEARLQKRGLWVDKNPVPPWHFRKIMRGEKPAAGNTIPENDLPIIGSRKSHFYYVSDCADYNNVRAKDRVLFDDVKEAEAAGYRKARSCQ
jgi:endonuclease YncB( thermonuclease family)